ncbi:MAG: hypothetical protein M0Z85_02445 [Gammaproteobacteria bacterium]|jgi:hypothetical protein|nr:hypothetical protein [Gammaproteobacteria bacterium]
MHEQKVNDAHELAYIQHVSGGCYETAVYLRGPDGAVFKVGPYRGGIKRARLYYEYFGSLMGHDIVPAEPVQVRDDSSGGSQY